MKKEEIEKICEHINKTEIIAQKASRESIKLKQCEFLEDKVDNVYGGVIVDVNKYGMLVEMKEVNCEGFVKSNEIGENEYFEFSPKSYSFIGYNSGKRYRLGDEIMVIIKSVDINNKNINLKVF
jgi:ribonuclease R